MDSVLSAERHLQCFGIQYRFGQQLLELRILRFQIPQSLRIRHAHATEFGAPHVKRGVAKAVLAAQFSDRDTAVGLLEKSNNLFIGKSLLHVRSPFRKRTLLDSDWHALLGAYQFDQLRYVPSQPRLVEIATGRFIAKDEQHIRGSGYCVESLEAALWCFFNTESVEEAILRAANLGDDADTTSAIAGQLAGAYYGVEAVPRSWIDKLTMREDIEEMAARLHERFGPPAG